jgi:uncharacterized protein YsxB (DUF464 family)
MTECIFDMSKFELVCKGHASEEGEDKSICAALTSLALTLAFNIDQAAELLEEKEVKIESGYYHIRVKPKEDARDQIEYLFTTIVNGIYMLSEDPELSKHITLEVIGSEI